VFQDVIVPEAQDANALLIECKTSSLIVFERFGLGVLAAVKFDRESNLHAIEVQNVPRHRNLPAELKSGQPP
jgi:hypothetical protein